MMGHPELVKEVKKEELGPLISPEGLDRLQNKYVQSVRVSRPQKIKLIKNTVRRCIPRTTYFVLDIPQITYSYILLIIFLERDV